MKEQKKIGIVTVLYNSESVLEDFFNTLNEQTYKNFVLYVIDNKSTDNSLALARSLSEKVFFKTVFFAEPKNWGVAKGNNIGIIRALSDGCDYILLANNDIVLAPDTIRRLYVGMRGVNATMAVPKIYYWEGEHIIWMAGGDFLWLQNTTCHRGDGEKDVGRYDCSERINYAPTCFMLLDSSVFTRVGLMNEEYFVYYDDTDFVWRATKLGQEILYYIHDAVLWHKVSYCTGGETSDFSLHYGTRNHLYFSLKYCRGIHLFLFLSYLFFHYILKDMFVYDRKQLKIMRNSYIEGVKLYNRINKTNVADI